MTNSEFKAWFDGYLEGVGGEPTAEQSARIREKLREVHEPLSVNAARELIGMPPPEPSNSIYAHVGGFA